MNPNRKIVWYEDQLIVMSNDDYVKLKKMAYDDPVGAQAFARLLVKEAHDPSAHS